MDAITPELFAECQVFLLDEIRRLDAISRLPGGDRQCVLETIDRGIRDNAVALVDLSADAAGVRLDSTTTEGIARRVAGLRPETAETLVAEVVRVVAAMAGQLAEVRGGMALEHTGTAINLALYRLRETAPEAFEWVLAALTVT